MPESLLLRGGRVLDVCRGDLVEADVLTVGSRIGAVAPGLPTDGTLVIDCSGQTVMPGLVDIHVHLGLAGEQAASETVPELRARMERNLALLLRHGVTTVRDIGGHLGELQTLSSPGRLLYAGEVLTSPDGHGTELSPLPMAVEVTTPEQAVAGVRRQLAHGASWIKLVLNGPGGHGLSAEHAHAAVTEARRHGLGVAAHASVPEAVDLAVELRVDTIEHGNGLTDRAAARAASQGSTLVPTLTIYEELATQVRTASVLPEAYRCATEAIIDGRLVGHRTAMANATFRGMAVAVGSDRIAGGPVVGVLAEIEAMERHGVQRMAALRSATLNGARALRLGDVGAVLPGWRADLIVVPGQVDRDITGLEQPTLVLAAGRAAQVDHALDVAPLSASTRRVTSDA